MISVVVPIYNAEKIILGNYQSLKRKLDELNHNYEIIFRDDGSRDRSKDILGKIGEQDPNVRVFSHLPNRGLGFTLRELFRDASGDIVVYLDIDLPFGIDSLPQLLKEIGDTDVVLASRYANLQSEIPLAREISSRLYYFLCRFLFATCVQDIGSGFVIFRRKAIDALHLSAVGFDIHIELFTELKRQGFSIKEIPLKYAYNGYSTFNILKHGPAILINTLKFWLKNR